MNNILNNPDFVADVALLCCAMNVCERANCPFSNTWLVDGDEGHVAAGGGSNVQNQPAALVQLAFAQHVHANVPLHLAHNFFFFYMYLINCVLMKEIALIVDIVQYIALDI